MPEEMSMHLDRGYDSDLTRKRLEGRGLIGVISEKGRPAPLQATKRSVERTNSWQAKKDGFASDGRADPTADHSLLAEAA
jgi:hypothetical protein